MQTVQRMLKDLGVILKEKDPTQEDHTDIRIEALMPKVLNVCINYNKALNNLVRPKQTKSRVIVRGVAYNILW